jgi:hypothetical protein
MRPTNLKKINLKLVVFRLRKIKICQNFKFLNYAPFNRSRYTDLSFLLILKYNEFRIDFLHIHQDFLFQIFW